jgi:vanillate O-demethylase ferredoxin subunit
MRFATIWGEADLTGISDVAAGVREFTIMPRGRPTLRFRPGAHLDIALTIGERPDTRSYSLVGRPGEAGYRIAVKRRDDGRGGSQAMWRLQPGARLNISDPIDSFSIEPGRGAHLLVAGGIGITPLVGMAEELVAAGAEVRLVHAARSRDDLAYGERLALCLGGRYRSFVSIEGERLDLAAEFAALAPGGLAAICGPMPMLDAARRTWAALGRPAPDLRWETFGSSGNLATEGFTVKLPRFGRAIEVPPSRSLLEALEEAGIEVISDCRRGECGLCAVDVLDCDGAIDHRDVFFSAHQKQESRKLCACVSRAHGTVTIDTAYRPD